MSERRYSGLLVDLPELYDQVDAGAAACGIEPLGDAYVCAVVVCGSDGKRYDATALGTSIVDPKVPNLASAAKKLRLVEFVEIDGAVTSERSIPFFREHLRPIFRRRLAGAPWTAPERDDDADALRRRLRILQDELRETRDIAGEAADGRNAERHRVEALEAELADAKASADLLRTTLDACAKARQMAEGKLAVLEARGK
jgi:hypothetical protein